MDEVKIALLYMIVIIGIYVERDGTATLSVRLFPAQFYFKI